jgi:hypothetical protein
VQRADGGGQLGREPGATAASLQVERHLPPFPWAHFLVEEVGEHVGDALAGGEHHASCEPRDP